MNITSADLYLAPATHTFTYPELVAHLEALLADGKTTGPNQSEAYIDYTRQNLQRNGRIYRTTELTPEATAFMQALDRPYRWLVIAEGWCGDVYQNLPIMARLAELTDQIDLGIILRDENPAIMDHFLTNGGKAIPILVVMDGVTGRVLGHWGPRPAPAQAMVMAYKALPEPKAPYSEFTKEVQLWYAHDRGRTLQTELMDFMERVAQA